MQKHSVRKYVFLSLLLGTLCLVSLRYGSTSMTWQVFFSALFGESKFQVETLILYHIRLPRLAGALCAGAGLSTSGVLLQCITENRMASPNLIGVNAGAGFAVILGLTVFPTATMLLPGFAFLGAFASSAFILLLSGKFGMDRHTVVLVGLAVSSTLSAGISLLSMLDSDILNGYHDFSVGSLSGVTLASLRFPILLTMTACAAAFFLAGRLNLLLLGDSMASALGVRVKQLRIVGMIVASLSAAAVVSFAGLIGFVGLMAPHFARLLFGENIKKLLPGSVLCGGILVTGADFLGRILFAPSEIPVGILLSLLGAPFFLLLLFEKGGDRHAGNC